MAYETKTVEATVDVNARWDAQDILASGSPNFVALLCGEDERPNGLPDGNTLAHDEEVRAKVDAVLLALGWSSEADRSAGRAPIVVDGGACGAAEALELHAAIAMRWGAWMREALFGHTDCASCVGAPNAPNAASLRRLRVIAATMLGNGEISEHGSVTTAADVDAMFRKLNQSCGDDDVVGGAMPTEEEKGARPCVLVMYATREMGMDRGMGMGTGMGELVGRGKHFAARCLYVARTLPRHYSSCTDHVVWWNNIGAHKTLCAQVRRLPEAQPLLRAALLSGIALPFIQSRGRLALLSVCGVRPPSSLTSPLSPRSKFVTAAYRRLFERLVPLPLPMTLNMLVLAYFSSAVNVWGAPWLGGQLAIVVFDAAAAAAHPAPHPPLPGALAHLAPPPLPTTTGTAAVAAADEPNVAATAAARGPLRRLILNQLAAGNANGGCASGNANGGCASGTTYVDAAAVALGEVSFSDCVADIYIGGHHPEGRRYE